MKRHRRIVCSSDDDEAALLNGRSEISTSNVPNACQGSSIQDSPHSSDVLSVICISSSSDSEPVGSPRDRGVHSDRSSSPAVCDNPLLFAAKHGYFPHKQRSATEGLHDVPSRADRDVSFWNTVPPLTCQYLNMEANHGDTSSSGSSYASDGSLTDGFIDKDEVSFQPQELKLIKRFLPVTAQRINDSSRQITSPQ